MIIPASKNTPPNLFRGLLLSPLLTTLFIATITWLLINSQIDELAAKRTSEYASSITKISADLSAEPLLSGDKLQLDMLVENVAKNQYIDKATIYSEDGQVVSEYSLEEKSSPNNSAISNALSNNELYTAKNIPYIEKIVYQNITAGWFKIDLNKSTLEADFRDSFNNIQIIILVTSIILFSILGWFVYRKNLIAKSVINSCQSLLIKNNITPSKNTLKWLESIKQLSRLELITKTLSPIRKSPPYSWIKSKKINNTIIILIDFKISFLINDKLDELSKMSHYLQETVQSFGAEYQGDIFSSVLVTFNHQDDNNAFNNALSIIHLAKTLFETLHSKINLKTCISQTDIIQLYDANNLPSNIIVNELHLQLIKNLLQMTDNGEQCIFNINKNLTKPLINNHLLSKNPLLKNSFIINEFPQAINQQIKRKFKYIESLH